MAYSDEMLANLVSSFPGNTENIATEGLRHVFDHSDASVEALNDVAGSGVRNLQPVEKVLTQVVGEDGTQPDLVGLDENLAERVHVEVKFWASLTKNQPIGYLNRLPADGPALLMFLAPADRVASLWPQLRRRVKKAGHELEEIDSERRCLRLSGTHKHLMVVSWDGLLDAMAARSRDGGEIGVETEIRQLRSLAKYANSGRFTPIGKREPLVPGQDRIRQYKGLIDAATERGIVQEWVSRKGLRATPREHGWGRYIRVSGAVVWFGINTELFERTSQTPLWVDCGNQWNRWAGGLAKYCDDSGLTDGRWVPVNLPRDVEYPEVLDGVVQSLRSIADVIAKARAGAD